MDTTRGIARSYDKLRALTCFHAHQLQKPSRPADALDRKLLRRQNADPPPRCRCRRLPEIRSLGLPPPPPHDQPHRPCFFRDKLQPPRCCHRKTDDFTDNGAQATETQPLLHRRQHILFPVGFGEDHSVGIKARLRKCGEKQVGTRHAPEDLTLRACRNTRDAKSRGGTIDCPRPAAGELVQRAIGKASARKYSVDLRNSKGKTAALACRAALQRGDALAQIGNDPFAGSSYRSRIPFRSRFRIDIMSFKHRCSLSVPTPQKSQATRNRNFIRRVSVSDGFARGINIVGCFGPAEEISQIFCCRRAIGAKHFCRLGYRHHQPDWRCDV
jgi:hypothetical protein